MNQPQWGGNSGNNSPGNNSPDNNGSGSNGGWPGRQGGGRRGGGGYGRGGHGGTALYDAIYLGSNDLMSKQQGRKALILLTDGEDTGAKFQSTKRYVLRSVPTRWPIPSGSQTIRPLSTPVSADQAWDVTVGWAGAVGHKR
ncbi:MAG: hypothetical protein M3Y72_04730 [Acidobacteriota bacterium]|nr:hypothetical protein [Acidobacteriota bacterium]